MSGWPTRRLLRLGFGATAAAASIGYWLSMPEFSRDFFGMIVVGAMAVLGSAATLIAVLAATRDEATPEWVILVLLFTGGVAMLLAMVAAEPVVFSMGLAVFGAGAACIGGPASPPAKNAKKRRVDA